MACLLKKAMILYSSVSSCAFKFAYRWPHGQAVKTAPSQGAITSSILVGVTKLKAVSSEDSFLFVRIFFDPSSLRVSSDQICCRFSKNGTGFGTKGSLVPETMTIYDFWYYIWYRTRLQYSIHLIHREDIHYGA